jgi:hypothetical protein
VGKCVCIDVSNVSCWMKASQAGVRQGHTPSGAACSNSADLAWIDNLSCPSVAPSSSGCSDLEAALSFEQFNAAYMGAKSYLCCDLLNFVGGLWLALLIIGCFGLPLTLAVFFWLGKMDRLQQRGWVAEYHTSGCMSQSHLPESADG